jgi:hypothetical protein
LVLDRVPQVVPRVLREDSPVLPPDLALLPLDTSLPLDLALEEDSLRHRLATRVGKGLLW